MEVNLTFLLFNKRVKMIPSELINSNGIGLTLFKRSDDVADERKIDGAYGRRNQTLLHLLIVTYHICNRKE
ncbi:hypothetical protein BRE01_65540 [Brevibacillus reuszeri]|uniref:Uncharacterized protein n=1 Tax=Brevibacillus reuszeri TaxID=54915 RepID=A0ABQ0TZW9_9BACL|nr:hypothetical protein BRE01_65540 [Brevibacillus reuszeri]